MGQIKNNFETTIINYGYKENCKITVYECGFKDISKAFKTTVSNGGFNTKDYFDKYWDEYYSYHFFLQWLFWT